MKSITSDEDLYSLSDRSGILLNNICYRDQLIKMPYDNYIINLSPSVQDGSHWVALYLNKRKTPVYFDSFGMVPPLEVIKLIRKSGHDNYLCNSKQVQDIRSGYCGEYCLMFLKYMNRPYPSQKNLSQFLAKFKRLN